MSESFIRRAAVSVGVVAASIVALVAPAATDSHPTPSLPDGIEASASPEDGAIATAEVVQASDGQIQAAALQVHWLDRLNSYRFTAGLAPVSEQPDWSLGARLHSEYLTRNDRTGHDEVPGLPGYSELGAAAGQNGNVVASTAPVLDPAAAIDSWMAAPFHALGLIDPRLTQSGFGSSSEGTSGSGIRSAATIDVIRGLDYGAPWPATPVVWPRNGVTVPIGSYPGYEWPDPLSSCPASWNAPSGLPVLVMFPEPPSNVTASARTTPANGSPSSTPTCVLTGSTYTNPDAGQQSLGRSVLQSRNAAIVMTPTPLSDGAEMSVTITATNPSGQPMSVATTFTYHDGPFGGVPVWAELTPGAAGHWVVTDTGMVTAAGSAARLGGMAGTALAKPVVAMQSTPSGDGYWLLASDGGIFTFGDARFHGSAGATALATPVVAMDTTPSGRGYWIVTEGGRVLAYGDARSYGDIDHLPLAGAIVDIARTASGRGYWLVAEDGGIFTFGDAGFHGSAGAIALSKPIVSMLSSASGNGYWLVAEDGGVFTYGDAEFFGSAGGSPLASPVRAMVRTDSGRGYWLLTERGQILAYGDATSY